MHNDHSVHFYDAEGPLVAMVVDFLAAGRRAGEAPVLFAEKSFRDRVEQFCRRNDDAGAASLQPGEYLNLDPAEILAEFPIDPPHTERSAERFAALLKREAEKANGCVCIFGTEAGRLHGDGQIERGDRLEIFWNKVGAIQPMNLGCSYALPAILREPSPKAFLDICAEHTRVSMPTEFWADYLAPRRIEEASAA